jgi:eukaryotic-like serine/threonine-protein kinase
MPVPDKTNRESVIFNAACTLPTGERGVYLDAACAGDPGLRQRLEALLAAHEAPDESLSKDKDAPAAKPTIKLELPDEPDEAVGQTLGRYKLMERLGEGGCGVVYVAEQTQPVRRRVALKVIKLGMDTKAVVARFEAERQALAMMDHPNIAKVLDAGTTDLGRPYFVMELVRGIRITDYCDQNQLSTKERLDLFIKVCQAIQHAHQKGIIHRDIKPSNILVTLHDGVPVPKVIDFGIAKATEGRLTDATVYTQLHQFIGTPAYMSPEQAEMSGLDIDTRSDIYSLGVLLYELLAGSTPFDGQELMSRGIDAMRKTIREQEPMRPSTRFATLKAEDLTTTAKRRSADKAKLMYQLKGDLDWIVMKCLEKDRTRRYETANGIAADLKRHLNNEPIVARPPSAAYRLQKAFRRNKLAFAAAGAVGVALLLGIIGSTSQAIRATHARREAVAAQANEIRLRQQAEADEQTAKTESARNEQTADFLLKMLDNGGILAATKGWDTTLLREMMDQAGARMSKDLAGNPQVEARLRGSLGWTYYSLGEYSRSEDSFRRCVELCRKGWENNSTNLDAQVGLGQAIHFLGLTLWHEGKLPEAEACQREALAIARKRFGDESAEASGPLNDLALVLLSQGKYAEAEEMYREALATRQKFLGNGDEQVGWSLFLLGRTLHEEGRLAEGESFIRKAQVIFRNLHGPKHPNVALMLAMLGDVLQQEGKLTEAESSLHEAVAMQKELLPKNHPDMLMAVNHLADVLEQQGKLDEAVALYRQAADAGRGSAQASLGRLYASGRGVPKDLTEAAKWYRQALEKIRPEADNGNASSMIDLARLLATCDVAELRDGPRAVSYAEKVVAVTDRKDPDALGALAAAYAETGQFDKAVATQKEAIAALTPEQNQRPFAAQLKRYEANTPTRDSDTAADEGFVP